MEVATMTKQPIPCVVLSDYDMLNAFVTLGHVMDTANDRLLLSLCIRDAFNFAMTDKDIHIAIDDVPTLVAALQEQYAAYKEAQS
jgi:hypothetical protein